MSVNYGIFNNILILETLCSSPIHLYSRKTYPLVICYIAIENTTFSSLNYLFKMVIFYSFLYVYQRLVLDQR